MTRIAALQIVGPAALGGGVLAAEGAFHALAWAPRSSLLWYLNLEVFHPFRNVQGILSANISYPDFDLSSVGLTICLLAICGYAFQRRLALALASNLSFLFATMLVVSLLLSKASVGSRLSLTKMSLTEISICCVLLASSLLSLAVSHLTYLRAIRAER